VGTLDAGPPSCCSLSCVQTTLDCGLFPPGTPDSTCVAVGLADGDTDSGSAIPQYAAQACSAANEAEEVGCIALKFPGDACSVIARDAGGTALAAQIGAACPGGFIAGNCDATCLSCRQSCEQVGIACNGPCLDVGGYYGCLACNAGCNLAEAKCEATCIGQ
jgi:hypothetical protein